MKILWFSIFLTIIPCILVIMTVWPSMLFSEEDKFRIDSSKRSICWYIPASLSHCTWIRFGGVSWTVNDKEDGGSKKRNISIVDRHRYIVYTRQLILRYKSHKVYLKWHNTSWTRQNIGFHHRHEFEWSYTWCNNRCCHKNHPRILFKLHCM